MKIVHNNIRITGKVQGVGFRETTKYFADQAGVKGFVRNEADGSVYIEVEAEQWVLESFVEWCNEGPDRAKVEGCEVTVSEELKHFKDFVILKK
ncbi:acylphosphatase [Pedobacter frigoris]|uniref:acylphosphatase n=1 Tax=Pedobacter frigoris TaxID=2571272 RepID=UPI00292FDB35|nr:acylphosphatase [Pedobacter frigoris]